MDDSTVCGKSFCVSRILCYFRIVNGVPFGKYNRHDIKQIQYKINRRPREKLGFDTPKRLFFLSLQEKVALVT